MKIYAHIQQPKISVEIKSGVRETLAIGAGTGDMRKSDYDTNNSGVVDNAERLGGQLPAYYATATDLATAYSAAQTAQASIAAHAALANPHNTSLEHVRAVSNAIQGLITGNGMHNVNSLDLNNTDYGTSGAVLKSSNAVVVVQDGRVLITDIGSFAGILIDTVALTAQLFNDNGSFTLNADGTLTTSGARLYGLPAPVATDEPVRLQELNTEVAAINAAMNTIGRVRGAIDFSTNPLLPASVRGDRWEASVAGLAGGPLGQPMQVWDELVCLNDSPGGTWAAQGANFYIVQGNADQATELLLGMLKIATQVLTNAETDDTTAVTPAKLGAWRIAKLGNVPNVDATNPANITQTASYRFVTDVEKAAWNALQGAIDAKVADAITNGVTTVAPSQNIVYDALYAHEMQWKKIVDGNIFLTSGSVAAADVYWHTFSSNVSIRQNVGSNFSPSFIYLKSSDYLSAIGLVPKLRIKISLVAVNDAAPGRTITVGLYPCSGPTSGTTGAANTRVYSSGTVVSGSEITFTTPAADTFTTDQYSATFDLPSDGLYAIASYVNGALAANSGVHILSELEYHFETT